MTPRSLVGMTMGARKRMARGWMECERLHQRMQDQRDVVDRQMGRRSQPRTVGHTPERLKQHYRIGQRLRPCPGCAQCLRCPCGNSAACIGLYEAWTKHQKAEPACNDCCGHGCEDGHCDKVDDICDGSGVLPARAKKVRR